jgi:nicotinate-nucleotide adenylyltransferase
MKVGFFGGTFDPIHFGHLNLAIELMERYHLDEVVFCPAAVSPLKEKTPPRVAAKHRKKMVALAIEPITRFSLLTEEVDREGPSFTFDTLSILKKQRKDVKAWHLILGEDTLQDFSLWKKAEELVSLAPPLVGSRTGAIREDLPLFLKNGLRGGVVKIPLIDVSSTVIRNRLEQGLYCGHLIPAKVLDYIYQNQLYSTSKHL